MTPVLALDLATRTGWALRDRHGVITSGAVDLGKGKSEAERFLCLDGWLRRRIASGALISDHGFSTRPTESQGMICWELPNQRGGAPTRILMGLRAIVIVAAERAKLLQAEVDIATLKRHATGKGNAPKALMVLAARKRWDRPDLEDEDEADALCVLSWALDEFEEAISG